MAKQKSTFKGILYENGDTVICMYCDDVRNFGTFRGTPQTIIDTKLIMNDKVQMIKFSEQTGWEVSNHYVPCGDTIDKYKDGLITIVPTETKIISTRKKVTIIEEVQEDVIEPEVFVMRVPRRDIIEKS